MTKQNPNFAKPKSNPTSWKDSSRLRTLQTLLGKLPTEKRPRLVLINEFELLICDGKNLSSTVYAHSHGEVEDLNIDRGQILDVFSKIEFLVNVMLTNSVGPSCSLDQFDKIMDRLELFTKIKLLNEYGILDNGLKDKLIRVKEVRDGFAHKWSERDVTYEKRLITDELIFAKFKQAMHDIWTELIRINSSIQPDVEGLIKRFSPKTNSPIRI